MIAPIPIVFKNPENRAFGLYAKSSIAIEVVVDDQIVLILK